MFLKIDTFILERIFTPFAWWFEYKTGRTNFFLAWWAYGFAVLFEVMALAVGVTRAHDLSPLELSLGLILAVGLGMMLAIVQRKDETARRSPATLVEKIYPEDARFRIFFFLMTSATLPPACFEAWILDFDVKRVETVLWSTMLLCYVCAIYFRDVQRPPPRPRREEEKAGQLQPAMVKS